MSDRMNPGLDLDDDEVLQNPLEIDDDQQENDEPVVHVNDEKDDVVEAGDKDIEDAKEQLRLTKQRLNREKGKNRKNRGELARLAKDHEDTRELIRKMSEDQSRYLQLQEVHKSAAEVENYYVQSNNYLRQAINEQDPAKIADANARVVDSTMRRQQVQDWLKNNQIDSSRRTAPAPAPKELREVRSWKRDNDWYDDPEYHEERAITDSLDVALARDPDWSGEIGSGDYMAELTKRIHKRMPHIASGDDRPQVQQRAAQRRPQTVAGSPMTRVPMRPKLDPMTIQMARDIGKPVDDPAYLKRLQGFVTKR